ncbi:MAG: hypothetical protein A3E84_04710 [Gammaproteobacteria bacterium RIFCSPHIGHO2_12_FULL_42_13]|nr:MAG: hypothetical protein A3E84_04710 [Gammaproteobacteria bacterium RIFCSPHIGHO2_12_FULL_42_13]
MPSDIDTIASLVIAFKGACDADLRRLLSQQSDVREFITFFYDFFNQVGITQDNIHQFSDENDIKKFLGKNYQQEVAALKNLSENFKEFYKRVCPSQNVSVDVSRPDVSLERTLREVLEPLKDILITTLEPVTLEGLKKRLFDCVQAFNTIKTTWDAYNKEDCIKAKLDAISAAKNQGLSNQDATNAGRIACNDEPTFYILTELSFHSKTCFTIASYMYSENDINNAEKLLTAITTLEKYVNENSPAEIFRSMRYSHLLRDLEKNLAELRDIKKKLVVLNQSSPRSGGMFNLVTPPQVASSGHDKRGDNVNDGNNTSTKSNSLRSSH